MPTTLVSEGRKLTSAPAMETVETVTAETDMESANA